MTTSSINELSAQLNVPLEIPTPEDKLVKNERIEGSPFNITTIGDSAHFLSLGNIKLSDSYATANEVVAYYIKNMPSVIMTACTTMMQMQIDNIINPLKTNNS